MENIHLLKIEINVEDYLSFVKYLHRPGYVKRLPNYTTALCPICGSENSERLNTYSAAGWDLGYGSDLYSLEGVTYHCSHFTLAQFFINLHGIWPDEARHQLPPEVPHVIGHILEDNSSLAVIHALPICRPITNEFRPSYTLYMLSYFADQPNKVFRKVTDYNVEFHEGGTTSAYIVPPNDCQHWWDLSRWVSDGKLYWVDSSGKKLRLRTNNANDFPYQNIIGRKVPHVYPYPYPPLSIPPAIRDDPNTR